jgi:hypothetical protein
MDGENFWSAVDFCKVRQATVSGMVGHSGKHVIASKDGVREFSAGACCLSFQEDRLLVGCEARTKTVSLVGLSRLGVSKVVGDVREGGTNTGGGDVVQLVSFVETENFEVSASHLYH